MQSALSTFARQFRRFPLVKQASVFELAEVISKRPAIDPRLIGGVRANECLIDVREKSEVARFGLAERGFWNLPMSMFWCWRDKLPAVLDPDCKIFVMCHRGRRSKHAAMWLSYKGFHNTYTVTGGIEAYMRDVEKNPIQLCGKDEDD